MTACHPTATTATTTIALCPGSTALHHHHHQTRPTHPRHSNSHKEKQTRSMKTASNSISQEAGPRQRKWNYLPTNLVASGPQPAFHEPVMIAATLATTIVTVTVAVIAAAVVAAAVAVTLAVTASAKGRKKSMTTHSTKTIRTHKNADEKKTWSAKLRTPIT